MVKHRPVLAEDAQAFTVWRLLPTEESRGAGLRALLGTFARKRASCPQCFGTGTFTAAGGRVFVCTACIRGIVYADAPTLQHGMLLALVHPRFAGPYA